MRLKPISQTPERFIDLTLAWPAMGKVVLSAMTCKCFGPACFYLYLLDASELGGFFGIFWGIPGYCRWFFGEFLILRNKKRPKIVMSRGGYQAVAFGDLHYQFLKPRHPRCMAQNLPVHLPKPTGFSNMSLAFTYSYSWKNWRVPFFVIILGRLGHWSRSFPGYRWKSLAKMWQCILLILCLGLIICY